MSPVLETDGHEDWQVMRGMVLHGYTDGASRGNPGQAACACVLVDTDGKVVATVARVIGIRTNNEAEYQAVIDALNTAGALSATRITVCSDSQLVVRQLRGEYRVRKAHLLELHARVKDLERQFLSVEYRSVGRSDPWIRMADRLCNEALDSANT
ncbi:MAG: Ribonuclease HI [Methanoregulaceae archaeon PtaU1.Bin059]|nr:MAG: Ribonuclease HI [Methanoregulaceae archaeon PtaB.Bin152]OPY40168.1 MAG: Ribonuclease HI [Methanoregulaceae archaeon PtaU1.Bin059]